jgi:hypothetical protein
VCCGCKEWVTLVSTSFLFFLSSFSVAPLYFILLFRRISSVVAALKFELLVILVRVLVFRWMCCFASFRIG